MQNPSVPSKSGLINNLVAHQYITPMKSKYRRTLVIRTRSYITGASQEAHTTQASKVVRFGFLFFLFFSILSRMARQNLAVNSPVVHSRSVPFKRLSYSNR